MSWRSAAYSRSSRSSGPSRCSPASRAESKSSSASRATWRACGSSNEVARASCSTLRSRTPAPWRSSCWPARPRSSSSRPSRRPQSSSATIVSMPRSSRSASRIAAPATMMSARAGVRPGSARRSVGRHRAEALGHDAQVLARERLVAPRRAPVERARRDGGEIHDGAGRAVGGGVGPAEVAQRVLRREAHAVLERLVVRRRVAPVAVGPRPLRGQPDGAERDGLHDVGAGGVAHGDLRAAAADVDDQRAPVDVHAAEEAEVDQPGLLTARDHVHLEPGRLAQEAHELGRVARLARGRRRDRHEAGRAVCAREVGEARAHGGRPLHRRRLEQAHLAELALAQPDGLLLHAEDGPGVVGREAHDHEARRVGADVDVGDRLGGDGRARRRRAPRRRLRGHVRP